MRKIFITGGSGQLGKACIPLFEKDYTVLAPRSAELDLGDSDALAAFLEESRPDVILHCGAWTAVDDAEKQENRERVWAVNAKSTACLADYCRDTGAKLVYVSTDYVFDGKGTDPWRADCRDFAPLNYYGLTKRAGEGAAETLENSCVVRTSWVFGEGKNFVNTMLRLGKTHGELRVVKDQIGRPTYAPDLARLLREMVFKNARGSFHACNEGENVSWAGFAEEIFLQTRQNVKILPVTTAEYGQSLAARPENSRLDTSKLVQYGFTPLPDWKDALGRYLKETAWDR